MRSTRWLLAAAVGTVGLSMSLAVVFSDGGDSTVVHACVHKSSQLVRITEPDEECRSNETPMQLH